LLSVKITLWDTPSLVNFPTDTYGTGKIYALHSLKSRYLRYNFDELQVYNCEHNYLNMGPSFVDGSVFVTVKSESKIDYFFKMMDTTMLNVYELSSGKMLELTSELKLLKGKYTLLESSGVRYHDEDDAPYNEKYRQELLAIDEENRQANKLREEAEQNARKAQEQNLQKYEAKVLYTGYNSEYKLKIEVQARVIYVLEENADLFNQNKRVLYKNEIAAEALYYRFPQNGTKWFSASSGLIYNCGQSAFKPCISLQGMGFNLGNPTYLE
jgi:hypothetical protein